MSVCVCVCVCVCVVLCFVKINSVLLTFYVFGSCFRTLAVILVSDLFSPQNYHFLSPRQAQGECMCNGDVMLGQSVSVFCYHVSPKPTVDA